MSDMMKVLTDLGVDFTKKEHKHYKFESGGFMDLTVETWKVGEWLHVSVAHYYVQEGDLMSDPEIEFRAINFTDVNGKVRWEIQPIHYRQDNLGVYQQAMTFLHDGQVLINPKLQREIRSFLGIWARNIRYQGYTPKQMKTC